MDCIGTVPARFRFNKIDPEQQKFCNEHCYKKKVERDNRRGQKDTIFVYLNKNMLDLAKSQGVLPLEFSFFIWSGHELAGVACFVDKELESIGDHETNTYDAWWREIGLLNIDIAQEFSSGEMREVGILSYLCDYFGISTEKNVACAIGSITILEGQRSPIQFFDTL